MHLGGFARYVTLNMTIPFLELCFSVKGLACCLQNTGTKALSDLILHLSGRVRSGSIHQDARQLLPVAPGLKATRRN